MGSALQRLIGEQHQRLASKFPEHKNWEFNTHKKAIEDRNWEIGKLVLANRDEVHGPGAHI
jgi:hypothetical protein